MLLSTSVHAQFKNLEDISSDALLDETQLVSEDPDKLEMIWWIPREYWIAVNAEDPTTSSDEMDDLLDLLEGFEIFAVVLGDINDFGGVNFTDSEATVDLFSVTYKETDLAFLDENDVPSNLRMVLDIMKPIMRNLLGPMGENINFVVAENPKDTSVIPIDLFGTDTLHLSLGDFHQKIELPLNAVIVEKKCPVNQTLYSGRWNYCPVHGKPLENQ